MSEVITKNAAWQIVSAQADSGNQDCIDCPYSKPTGAGSGHHCEAEHPRDCHVLESLLERLDADIHDKTAVEELIDAVEFAIDTLGQHIAGPPLSMSGLRSSLEYRLRDAKAILSQEDTEQ